MIVVYSRDNELVGMAHKVKSPKNQLRFSQTTMGHFLLGKTELQIDLKHLQKVAIQYLFN